MDDRAGKVAPLKGGGDLTETDENRIISKRYACWKCPTHVTGLRWKDKETGEWKTPNKGCGKFQFMKRDFDAETGIIIPTQAKCNEKDCAKRPRISQEHVEQSFPATRKGKDAARAYCERRNDETGWMEWF